MIHGDRRAACPPGGRTLRSGDVVSAGTPIDARRAPFLSAQTQREEIRRTTTNQKKTTASRITMVEEKEQAKQLDSVTDVVQEQEVDADRAQQAMSALASPVQAAEDAENDKTTVSYSKQDVELIVNELEVTEELAVKTLREVAGDVSKEGGGDSLVVAALRKLVTS
jgi:NACalpha-BTF3-like transcription factor